MRNYRKLLNKILDDLPEPTHFPKDFYTRLGANFFAISQIFEQLYGNFPQAELYFEDLIVFLREFYQQRAWHLLLQDRRQSEDNSWFLHQSWVAMEVNFEACAKNWEDLTAQIEHWQDLGINIIYLKNCPKIIFTAEKTQIEFFAQKLAEKSMLLAAQMSLNFVPQEHEWARRAFEGHKKFLQFFHVFEDKALPDVYNQYLKKTPHQNFIFVEHLQKYFMASSPQAHLDLDYAHAPVFLEMLKQLLFLANQGLSFVVLQNAHTLWKKLDKNLHLSENHLVIQLLKRCIYVVAPSVILVGEDLCFSKARSYFGEARAMGKELDLIQNPALPTVLAEALAIQESRILRKTLQISSQKPFATTWINTIYKNEGTAIEIHENWVQELGFEVQKHLEFLKDYYSQNYEYAQPNTKIINGKIQGTLSDWVALWEQKDEQEQQKALDKMKFFYALLFALNGLPMIHWGDEWGISWNRFRQFFKLNDKKNHLQEQLFNYLKKIIAIRKNLGAFANFNNISIENCENKHLLVFSRWDNQMNKILVIANFHGTTQHAQMSVLQALPASSYKDLLDEKIYTWENLVAVEPYTCLWLSPL